MDCPRGGDRVCRLKGWQVMPHAIYSDGVPSNTPKLSQMRLAVSRDYGLASAACQQV